MLAAALISSLSYIRHLTCTIICCFGKRKYLLVLTGQKIIQSRIFFGLCFGFAKATNNCAGQCGVILLLFARTATSSTRSK